MSSFLNRILNKKKPDAVSEAKSPKEPALSVEEREELRKKRYHNELLSFINADDFEGAIGYVKHRLERENKRGLEVLDNPLKRWLAYCYYRAGNFAFANAIYKDIASDEKVVMHFRCPPEIRIYAGVCAFHNGDLEESTDEITESWTALETRLKLHAALRLQNESLIKIAHGKLTSAIEDQLSLASVHFHRGHFFQSREIIETLHAENPKFIALKYYLAMCYLKLDYPSDAKDLVKEYLTEYPDSLAAHNLLNCCNFRQGTHITLNSSDFAEYYPAAELLYRHNKVVFDRGLNAMQVLPALTKHIPEAQLNLVIHNLNRGEIDMAKTMAEQLRGESVPECMAKALVYSIVGQKQISREMILEARSLFYGIAVDENVRDTIPGRQCGASSYFLDGDFESVVVYLNSIKGQYDHDDNYYFNLGQALVRTGRYEEAIACLNEIGAEASALLTQNLVRAYVMNRQPEQAWDLFMKVRSFHEHPLLLRIIASDSFKTGQYACTARAYDALEKMDPSPDHWIGKRAAVAGQFQLLVQGKCTGKEMAEVLEYLENGTHSQIESISNTIRNWAKENGVSLVGDHFS